jgi:hypothetical protein
MPAGAICKYFPACGHEEDMMKLRNARAARALALDMLIMVELMALVPATAVSAQVAPVKNQITVRSQNLDTGIVVVDAVTTERSGWVVVYKAPDFTADNLVGKAAVHAGTNLGVKVVVSLPVIDHAPMLWAVLQADDGTPHVFEWGLSQRAYADAPIAQNGQVVMALFATATPAPLPAFLTTVSGGASIKKVPTDQITVHDQDVRSGLVVVDAITTTEPGWVVFYRNPNLTPGEIVGYAPVYPGVNTNVKAAIDTTKPGKSTEVWAQLHTDEGRPGVFEWARQQEPLSDWPLIQNRRYVRASFSTIAAPAPAAPVDLKPARLTVHDQTLDSGIVTLDSVVSPFNGWVVIYRDPDFTAGDIVGYAPIYKGTNMGVKVNVDTAKVGDRSSLFPVLQRDGGLQNIFEWGNSGRTFSDPPVFQNGQYISAAFGTAAGPQP